MIHDALFYQNNNSKLKCFLCPHNCIIDNEKFGRCSVRTNKNGFLKSINYGEITSIAQDPIEKKPLYHFKPGKNILSVGSYGCNLECSFCQNYSIAHHKSDSKYIESEKLIDMCVNLENNVGIAFTYNEPSIWYEYVYDTSKQLKEKYPDISIVLVTNGYIEEQPLKQLLPYVDAMNIDLKSFSEDSYRKICGGELKAVLNTIENSFKECHIEITTLLIPGINDEDQVEKIALYISSLDKSIPLHLSRYFPNYKMNRPPTEIDFMLKAKEIAKKYLNYVYLGNLATADNSTYCPKCQKIIINRDFYTDVHVKDANCSCGFNLKIVT